MGRPLSIAALAAALLFALPFAAHSAGLGRLSVLSSLGQPLRAEIEIVSVQTGEEDGLVAKLAPTEAFAQAGIELSPALLGIRFAIDRREGRSVLRLTTVQPVNEPFLEMLVELQWNNGRLVREYTFLLDPPEYNKARQAIAATPAPAPAAAAPGAATPAAAPGVESRPLAPSPAPAESTGAPAAPIAPAAPAPRESPAAEPKAAAPATAQGTPQSTYEVKKGDTLGAIARQNLPAGVSLNQMLIALFRANEAAFIRGNINLVRSGRILVIPDADSIGTIDRAEANKIVRTHVEQWNEYRSRLATVPAPAAPASGQREASGRIDAKPAVTPAPQQDQLRLSKSEPKQPGSTSDKAAKGDDAASKQRALQEAQSREAELKKNVADLEKLTTMQNQQMAAAQKQAEAAKPAAEAPKPAPEAPKPPAEAPKPAAAAPAAPATPAKPAAEAPKPAAEAPKPAAEAPKPAAETPKPAAEAPKPPAKKAASEPSVFELFAENQMALVGLGGVILLLAGYGFYAWKRKKAAQAKFQDSVLGAASTSATGGPSSLAEPTGNPAAAGAAPAAAAPAASSEDVDPIAEADVYMAYGRDAQAEEILKEALQKDGTRSAVHVKLLEIYASRKDAKAFEQTALKLKGLTNGAGAEWDKAAGLGRSIDPGNGLYAGAGGAAAPAAAPAAAAAPAVDFDLGGTQTAAPSAPDISLDEPAKEASAPTIDFDLGSTTQAIQAQKDVSHDETVLSMETKKAATAPASMDFNLDLGGDKKAEAPAAAPAAGGGLEFDLNLDLGGDKKAEAPAAAPAMDLSSISLDLGAAGGAAPSTSTDPKWQEVATKLDLAKAYEEMGDKDGARELLNEVMKDGDAAQKGQAQQLLAKLG